MTDIDKKRFDEIFHGDKYFKNVSDVDMLRTAGECDKLREYILKEIPGATLVQCMHFAYWLGIYRIQKTPLTAVEVLTKLWSKP